MVSAQNKLFKAISKGYLNQIRFALLDGADLEALDEKGRPALIRAACQTYKSLEMVQLLVEKGANVNARCHTFGSTALEHAMTGRPRLVETACFLLDAGTRLDVISNTETQVTVGQKLINACFYDANLFPCFEKLMTLGIYPVLLDGYSPLESIIRSMSQDQNNLEYTTMLTSLIQQYPALVNLQNDSGCTPLHIACWLKKKSAVKLLLDAGADLEVLTPNQGQSALDMAWRDKDFGAWFLAETEKRTLSTSLTHPLKTPYASNRL